MIKLIEKFLIANGSRNELYGEDITNIRYVKDDLDKIAYDSNFIYKLLSTFNKKTGRLIIQN